MCTWVWCWWVGSDRALPLPEPPTATNRKEFLIHSSFTYNYPISMSALSISKQNLQVNNIRLISDSTFGVFSSFSLFSLPMLLTIQKQAKRLYGLKAEYTSYLLYVPIKHISYNIPLEDKNMAGCFTSYPKAKVIWRQDLGLKSHFQDGKER